MRYGPLNLLKENIFSSEESQLVTASVKRIQDYCHGIARECGWWTNPDTGRWLERNKGELLCLIHSEISEAMEGVRKNMMDDHLKDRKMEEVELADAIIRILDYAGAFNLDVPGALVEKLQYNCSRQDHKPENRLKFGGKKF